MPTPSPVTPTIGRIVLVPVQTKEQTSAGSVPGPVVIRPGIIVNVAADALHINVRAFGDGSNDNLDGEWLTGLSYDQDNHSVGTYHWMPFQLQQAKPAA